MMDKDINMAVMILIGGKSSRMGSDKYLLSYDGESAIQRAINLVAPLPGKKYISIGSAQKTSFEFPDGVQLLTDLHEDCGPLGALVTFFESTDAEALLVLPCDLPLLKNESLQVLLNAREPNKMATVAKTLDSNYLEPLVAIYERKCYLQLKQALDIGQLSLQKILKKMDIHVATFSNVLEFKNVNNQEEYRLMLKEFDKNFDAKA